MALQISTAGGGSNSVDFGHNAVTDAIFLGPYSYFVWGKVFALPYFSSNAALFSKGDSRSGGGLFSIVTASDGVGTANNVEVHNGIWNNADAAWVYDGPQDT